MELERYTLKELEKMGRDIFYDYMSSTNELYWFDFKFSELNPECATPAHQLHMENVQVLLANENRIHIYEEALKSPLTRNVSKDTLEKELLYLMQEHEFLANSNMDFQKRLYKATNSTDYCRTAVRIPLNKKINSFYDDLILEVIFYDDVCTTSGKFNEYNMLETKEERYKFIEENTKGSSITLLPSKFSDFKNLSLADLSEIRNNDLRQILQSKIDLDKENMIELACVNIRGDLYTILKSDTTNELYIRYVCRSTGRVYYNVLNVNNLALSLEFMGNDYESYARAWWNINTLGSSTDGKPVIRL